MQKEQTKNVTLNLEQTEQNAQNVDNMSWQIRMKKKIEKVVNEHRIKYNKMKKLYCRKAIQKPPNILQQIQICNNCSNNHKAETSM